MKTQLPDFINGAVDTNYTQVPNHIIRSPEISAVAKAVLMLLLSNKNGWRSNVSALTKKMKEGKDSVYKALSELEEHGYLIILHYRSVDTGKFAGSVWLYTNEQHKFNLEHACSLIANFRCTVSDKTLLKLYEMGHVTASGFTGSGVAGSGVAVSGNPDTNNTNTNKTKFKRLKRTNSSLYRDKPIPERNKTFVKYAEHLGAIIRTTININHTKRNYIRWANEIRKLHEEKGVSRKRIIKALRWYEKNIQGEFVPHIQSGKSLYLKFEKLEAAQRREEMDKKRSSTKQLNNTYYEEFDYKEGGEV